MATGLSLHERGPWLYRALAALGLALLGWVLLHPRGEAVQILGMDWQRLIEIEREVMEMHGAPCADMPASAQLLQKLERSDAEHCRFMAPAWRMRRLVAAQGQHPDRPRWPDPGLQPGERSGIRHARQTLHLGTDDGRRWECPLPVTAWQVWQPGMRTRLAVHRFSGVADCASLAR